MGLRIAVTFGLLLLAAPIACGTQTASTLSPDQYERSDAPSDTGNEGLSHENELCQSGWSCTCVCESGVTIEPDCLVSEPSDRDCQIWCDSVCK